MGASSVKPAVPYVASPVLESNSANIARKAKLNTNIAKELSNYNRLTPEEKIIAKQTNPKIANALSNFNKLHRSVKNAIITQNPHVGGKIKTRKHRATKKAHKNKRCYSRRN